MATQQEEILLRMGFNSDAVQRGTKAMLAAQRTAADIFKQVWRGAMGFVGVGSLMEAVNSAMDKANEIRKAASITGQSVEGIQKIDSAAESIGVSAETANSALEKLNINIGEANTGSKEMAEKFAKWSINITNKSNAEVLAEISDRMKEMADPAERAAMAMDLMGRTGKELVPLLEHGADAIADMASKRIFSQQDIDDLKTLNETIVELKATAQLLTARAVSWLSESAKNVGVWFGGDITNVAAPSRRELDLARKERDARITAAREAARPRTGMGIGDMMRSVLQIAGMAADWAQKGSMLDEFRKANEKISKVEGHQRKLAEEGTFSSIEDLAGRRFVARNNREYGPGGRYDLGLGNSFAGNEARELFRLTHGAIQWDRMFGRPGSVAWDLDRINQLKTSLAEKGVLPQDQALIDIRMATTEAQSHLQFIRKQCEANGLKVEIPSN